LMDESAEGMPALCMVGRRWWWGRVAALGRAEAECTVWRVLVGVVAVDAEDVVGVAACGDEDSVKAVGVERSYQRSAWAFAFGAWIGVRITVTLSVRKIS
jgi:hypothetical protein